jgi:hypothetical protein
MSEIYIKKLEEENARLYRERKSLYSLIKNLSESNNLSITFASAVTLLSTEKIKEYVFKNYEVVSKSKSAFEESYILQIGNKKCKIMFNKSEQNIDVALSVELLRAVWEDFCAKQGNNKTLSLLIDIMDTNL